MVFSCTCLFYSLLCGRLHSESLPGQKCSELVLRHALFFFSRRLSYVCNLRALWTWYRHSWCYKDLMQDAFLLLSLVACSTQCHRFICPVLSARLELAKFAVPVNMAGTRLGVWDPLWEGQVIVLWWPSSDVLSVRCHHRNLARLLERWYVFL